MKRSVEDVAHALGQAKKIPNGYKCKCPCHDDKQASLAITESPAGEIIFHCFAGCDWKTIKDKCADLGLVDAFVPRVKGIEGGARRFNKYEGAIFYVYKDIVGNIICRKCKKKLPDGKKIFWNERYESGAFISGLDGLTIPLYNLQAVVASEVVYLAEGEKDAETLINAGLCGTTSHSGAKYWGPHLTEQLKNKTVVILPDNDEPGKERVRILTRALQGQVKELRCFVPDNVPDKGDITDWVEAGGNPAEIFAKSTVIEKKQASKKATRDEYFALFDEVLGNPRRCIFSGKLMYKEPSGLWNPCLNEVERIKSEALHRNETSVTKFNVSEVPLHLAALQHTKEPELLVDIPEWDGEDRISAMAYLVTLKATSGVEQQSFSELLKEWCALVFQRLHDPMIQNRVLVLQGGQGIGKDTWTSMLCDGLGQFCVPLNVVGEDKDTYLSLTAGLVMKISEFDKTSRTEVSTLKDLITAPSTNIRAPYDKDSKLRLNRCSFISSANAEQLLRDSTGNRRFMIFEVEHIEYGYRGWTKEEIHNWQMQCLAEMQYLAATKYTASETAWRQMREYIEGKTPEDFVDDLAAHFLQEFRKHEAVNLLTTKTEVDPGDAAVREICAELAKEHGVKLATVRGAIQAKYCVQRRVGASRVRVLRLPS